MSSSVELSLSMLSQLMAGEHLSQEQAYALMIEVMEGRVSTARLAGLLTALRTKGETVDEITGFAQAMRENVVTVKPQRTDLIDTCGTGGDASGTFNISTATAFVAAAMGCAVAKHGNRAVSSACGSADVLEALGVDINQSPTQVAAAVDEIGLGFLFAPSLHPSMKHAMPARRELGVRTVFNVLGPLTNPAGAKRQLLGVFDGQLCEPLAQVLAALGSEKAFVVHGEDGLDEVSLMAKTKVATLSNGVVSTTLFAPRDVGLQLCKPEEVAGGSVEQNATIITNILNGEDSPAADVVVLNAAFVAVLADRADDIAGGVALARQKLQDGSAQMVLEQLKALSGGIES